MKKYQIIITNGTAENTYISTSRNAKKHLRDYGGDKCLVADMHGNNISGAINSPEFGIVGVTV